ncbi:MAG TPA: hypothetical protein VNI83_02260 [Vicinamibacterales bacterium]|nr:hypothetical protein [Vicinamibacterales bacterium]
MAWVKLDEAFFDHPKIASLSDAAVIAYLQALCYCNRNLTDGFVPLKRAREFAGKSRVFNELVPHLWELCEGGIFIHDYLDYQPSRAQVLAERAGRLEAKVRAGKARAAGAPRNAGRFTSTSTSTPPAHHQHEHQHTTSPDPDPDPDPDPRSPIPDPAAAARARAELPADFPPEADAGLRRLQSAFENRIGVVPPASWAEFREYVRLVPEAWFEAAIGEAVEHAERPSWRFVKAVLDRCLQTGRPPGPRKKPGRQTDDDSIRSRVIRRFDAAVKGV